MNSYRQSSESESKAWRRFVLFTCVVITFVVSDMLLHGAVRSYARGMITPVVSGVSSTARYISDMTGFASRSALLSEVESLEREVGRLRERDALFQVIARENTELRELARLGDGDAISATVLSSFWTSPYGTFLIGAGRAEGVLPGAIALTPDGFALGVVADVSDHSSTVRFAFAPESHIDVSVGDFAFSLVGRGLTRARAEVPREADIAVGMPVFAPQYDAYPVGIVAEVASTTSSVYSNLYITLPTNLNSLRFVRVLPSKISE